MYIRGGYCTRAIIKYPQDYLPEDAVPSMSIAIKTLTLISKLKFGLGSFWFPDPGL